MKRRIIIAFISALLFSLILSILSYSPASDREPNSWYEDFSAFIQVYLIFSIPAYVLGGVPITWYIDKQMKSEFNKLFLYLLAGFSFGCTIVIISFKVLSYEVLSFGIVGLFASFIFYILFRLTNYFIPGK